MTIVLYDLVGIDDRRFSPNCWRSRMAIAHKGLDCDPQPTRFSDIAAIGGGNFATIPVIADQGRLVGDSWAIAEYLEATYPDRPSLFGGAGGKALTRFMQSWSLTTVYAGIVSMVVHDIHEHLVDEDKPGFRESREQRFGRTLEEVQAGREDRLDGFRKSLQPLRLTLASAPFLGGEQPLYADHLVFGGFQWARVISPFKLLAEDDPVHAWFERCLDLYGGIGRAARGYD